MSTQTVIAPVTAAVTAKTEINAQPYEWVTIIAENLAGAETVPVFYGTPGGYVAAKDASGSSLALTASVPMLTFSGGCFYYVTKDATAGACGVYVTYGPGINR